MTLNVDCSHWQSLPQTNVDCIHWLFIEADLKAKEPLTSQPALSATTASPQAAVACLDQEDS